MIGQIAEHPRRQHVPNEIGNDTHLLIGKIFFMAITTLLTTIGILTALASSGVYLGPLNALSNLSVGVGITFAITGGIPFILGVAKVVHEATSPYREDLPPSFHCEKDLVRKKSFETLQFPDHFNLNERKGDARTLIYGNYPAHYISCNRGIGLEGNASFIIGIAPQTVEQQQIFYKALSFSGACLVISLDPRSYKEISPALLENNDRLVLELEGEPSLEATSPDERLNIQEIRYIDHGNSPPFYQILPTGRYMLSELSWALSVIRTIKRMQNCYGIPVDNRHPMIVLSKDGKDTGAFIALYHLVTEIEERISSIGEDVWEHMITLCKNIEKQSFTGSATAWMNTAWNNEQGRSYLISEKNDENFDEKNRAFVEQLIEMI